MQAIGKAVGIDPETITSPTFTLVHQYPLSLLPNSDKHLGEGGLTGSDEGKKEFENVAPHPNPLPGGGGSRERARSIISMLTVNARSRGILGARIEEMFESDGWTIIEWSDRVEECLPKNHLHVMLEVVSENERRATLTAHGAVCEQILQTMQANG